MYPLRLRFSSLPIFILAIGLALAVAGGLYTQKHNETRVDEAFAVAVSRTHSQLLERMLVYEAGLRGTRGSIIGAGGRSITRSRFSEYIASRQIEREFPGARGFGFIRRVPVKDEAAFLRSARADGWPDFTIRQLQANTLERFVIQYIEPVANNRQAIGLDIGSEGSRRSAALTAVLTGEMTLTAPITLVQADGKKNQGFLMLLPVFQSGMPINTEAERLVAAIGWVYAPLVIDEVLKDFAFNNEVALRLLDITDPHHPWLFYTEPNFPQQHSEKLKAVSTQELGGRLWQLGVHARPELSKLQNFQSPWLVFSLLAVIPIALATLLHYVLRSQQQAVQAAAEQAQYRKLAEATALQKAIQENAGYALITTNTDGIITSFNPAAETMLGYRAEELIGKESPAVFHDRDEVIARAATLSKELGKTIVPGFDVFIVKSLDGHADSNEWTYIGKDGKRIPVWLTVTALQDAGGKVFGFLGIAADISTRKEADERFRRVVDAAPTPILIADLSGMIITVNIAASRVFGYNKNELPGQNISILIPNGLRDKHTELVQGYIDHPQERPMGTGRELQAQRKNGEVFAAEVGLSPIQIGQSTLIMALVFDVTERRAHEAALQKAKVAAEDAARAKSEFLANMSHEIRTPMNAIMGLTQLVLESKLDDRQADYLGKVKASSQALLGILNDILDFSKIEAGRLSLEEREFGLDEVMEGSANLFMLQAEQKGLEILIEMGEGLPQKVVGDSLRLSQVLNNLIGNSIKFTEHGEILVSAQWVETDATHHVLRFAVRDTGIGLSQEQAASLFQPFTQADTSTTRKHGGTGLGLTICKRLVELMGGDISLSSHLGEGTTFSFTVRLGIGSQPTNSEQDLHDVAGMRVLIADDHDSTLTLLTELLTRWKMEVQCLSSGMHVLSTIKLAFAHKKPFDILLLDWKMPGMDGVEVVHALEKAIQAGDITKSPLVMMSTAFNRDELLRALGSSKVDGILTKPTTPSNLFDTIISIRKPNHTTAPQANANIDYQTLAKPMAGLHILLAEDNPLNQQVAQAFLVRSGFKVSIADNGEEAIEMLKAQAADNPYAAILMDMQMPVLDGVDATRLIRDMPGFKHLPIIAMTANAMLQDKEICLAAGMNDHIAKPIMPRQMIETMLKCLHPETAAAPATDAVTHAPLRTLSALNIDVLRDKIATLDSELDRQRLKAKQLLAPIEAMLEDTALSLHFQPVADAARALKFKQARVKLAEFTLRLEDLA